MRGVYFRLAVFVTTYGSDIFLINFGRTFLLWMLFDALESVGRSEKLCVYIGYSLLVVQHISIYPLESVMKM